MLDTLDADDTLTSEQKKQVSDLRKQLEEAEIETLRQEVNEQQQQKSEKWQEFVSRMDELEESDLKIDSATTIENKLALTTTAFEQWDVLLMEMYDYLAGVLNADQFASEKTARDQWEQKREEEAKNAAEGADGTAAQLASYSFRQSYTKARCYKLLDMM